MQKRDSIFLWCEGAIVHSIYRLATAIVASEPSSLLTCLRHTNTILYLSLWSLTFSNSQFCLRRVFTGFVWLSKQNSIISLYTILFPLIFWRSRVRISARRPDILTVTVVYVDGARLCLWTVATNGPIFHRPDYIWVWKAAVEWYGQGKLNNPKQKTVPVPVCHQKSHMDLLGRETGPPQWEACY
jgi:hypothetical protein